MSKLTESSRGQSCVRCGANDGTICSRHYAGVRQHLYGKGRGTKCHDLMAADLCHNCDMLFSEGRMPEDCSDKWQKSEAFLHLIALTNIRRFERGIIKT